VKNSANPKRKKTAKTKMMQNWYKQKKMQKRF
jgi:hypothetical protein